MEREVCLRCGGIMAHIGQEELQKGKFSWFWGAWPNLISGALSVDIYCCTECKKMEFYMVEVPEDEGSGIAKAPCPYCGQLHEVDDAKCPHCGKRLF